MAGSDQTRWGSSQRSLGGLERGPQRRKGKRGRKEKGKGWEEKGRVGKEWERKGMQEKVRDEPACMIYYVPSN